MLETLGNAPLPVVILVSGRGSNLEALIAARDRGLPIAILAVICDHADAPALALARAQSIPTQVLSKAAHPDRTDYDAALARMIDALHPRLIVLAGFMRLLSTDFVNRYLGKLINIHPSLLPAFPGLHTHRRALEARVKEHGASVHFVIPAMDAGPIVSQVRVPVLANDTADTLAQRVLSQEHRLYPATLRLLWEARVQWHQGRVLFDGQVLESPLQLTAAENDHFI